MIHKTTRSILSVLLAALLLVTSVPLTPAFAGDGGAVSLQSESAEGSFAGGTGTANDPYKIATANDLREFAQRVNNGELADANAVLTADIDLNREYWNPIGNSEENAYTGTFDGNGKTISGLYINNSTADDQGLFGYVGTGGTVKDLTVSGSVSGNRSVGGVVGDNRGNVENCYNIVEVSGNQVGGVVGYNGGTVENCHNTGTVSDPDSGTGNRVGGVVGWNISSVTNCYNTGSVTGVTGSSNYVGGVVGYNSGPVKNCYFLQGTAEKGIGNKEDAEGAAAVNDLNDQKQFKGWDFADTWRISQSLGFPVLQDNAQDGLPPGLGTEASPYEISTATQLENFRDLVNDENDQTADPDAHAKLMNNIDLSSVCSKEKGNWPPIGSISNPYKGTFDGNGKTIENLYINKLSSDYQGLFGRVNGGTVKDLTVSGTVSGNYNVGGVVGYNNGGTVTGCIFSGSGSVSGKNYVGGVVGYNDGGTVTGCIFSGSGSVSGEWYVGGIAGQNNGTVENCYNTGSVNGSADSSDVGGVVGLNRGTVENCYNTDSVSGIGSVGGIVGYNVDFDGYSASVENCYNTGSVTVTGSDGRVGGVVGQNYNGTVTGCYFLQTETVNTKLQGIGENDGSGDATATAKDNTAFHSGEVAWLLQNGQTAGEEDPIPQVWGQSNLTATTSLPTLVALDKANAQKVYQVTFDYGDLFTDIDERFAYSYTNGVVSEPDKNPALAGHTLSGWYSDESLTTEWNFATEISNDTTLYAKWTPVAEPDPDPEPTPEPEPEEPPYTGKYSYELSTSVGDHGTLAVDRYATEGEKVTITVTPDEAYLLDDLSVTAGGKDVELVDNGDGTYTFTMPSADVRITATFAEDPDWTPDEPEEPTTDVSDLFIDIAPDAWYKDAVQYAYDNGLMTGVSATEFAPEQTTTRAMIVSILARLENVTTAEAAGFADVDDEWYATAVNWAANVGVVNGYEDNTFRPNTAITREQLAAILMNYAACIGQDVSNRADLTSYTDQPSTWAQEAMQWAVAEGLISGVTNDQLQPQSSATRAQVAAILQRLLEA